jgi:hypothetical protein
MSPAICPCWYGELDVPDSLDASLSPGEAWSPEDDKGDKLARAFFRFSSEREIRVQRYAFLENNCAIARPMPRLPPVMRTCFGRLAMVGLVLFGPGLQSTRWSRERGTRDTVFVSETIAIIVF